MRKLLSVTLGVSVLACMAAYQAPQQDAKKAKATIEKAEAKYQDQENPMYLVIIEHVKPSMIAEYEASTAKLIKTMHDHKIDPSKVNFRTVSGPELGYAFVVPLEKGFESMPKVHDNWMKAIEKIGEERWADLTEPADEAVEYREFIHCVLRTDISYMPSSPRLAEDEFAYIGYTFYYPIAGKEKQVEEVATQFASLYERNNITDGWMVYECITGSDLPLYVVAFPARSQADFAMQKEKIAAILGAEGEALHHRSIEFARKIETKDGMIRRDLSYTEGH